MASRSFALMQQVRSQVGAAVGRSYQCENVCRTIWMKGSEWQSKVEAMAWRSSARGVIMESISMLGQPRESRGVGNACWTGPALMHSLTMPRSALSGLCRGVAACRPRKRLRGRQVGGIAGVDNATCPPFTMQREQTLLSFRVTRNLTSKAGGGRGGVLARVLARTRS